MTGKHFLLLINSRHHIDYFGLAAVAHCLLFGQYIEIKKVQGKWMPKTNIKVF